jgi:hypothetical protein
MRDKSDEKNEAPLYKRSANSEKLMAGPYIIMAIPLANSVAATAQTVLPGAILSLRLQKRIKRIKAWYACDECAPKPGRTDSTED